MLYFKSWAEGRNIKETCGDTDRQNYSFYLCDITVVQIIFLSERVGCFCRLAALNAALMFFNIPSQLKNTTCCNCHRAWRRSAEAASDPMWSRDNIIHQFTAKRITVARNVFHCMMWQHCGEGFLANLNQNVKRDVCLFSHFKSVSHVSWLFSHVNKKKKMLMWKQNITGIVSRDRFHSWWASFSINESVYID